LFRISTPRKFRTQTPLALSTSPAKKKSSVVVPELLRLALILVDWIRIRNMWANMNSKKSKKKLLFWSAGLSLLRAGGFSCSLNLLQGSIGINILQFLIQKIWFFSTVKYKKFWTAKPWIRIRICIETNADPQHWQKEI
jgi:hypothetical protein